MTARADKRSAGLYGGGADDPRHFSRKGGARQYVEFRRNGVSVMMKEAPE